MAEEIREKGGISVETEHIFPIIKRWLYSDKEIFLREIVSNASDAITKLERLVSLGEVRDIEVNGKIKVSRRTAKTDMLQICTTFLSVIAILLSCVFTKRLVN